MKGNRLSKESSLYLQQHANNPVDWWPWCDEAFELAEKENKPVLVSIGYSSCHWCHVMAHECFEDDYIANMMNRMFVNIKVDREERPDVDQIYMEAVQMLSQQGGWPLNVFCFPDKKPFMGGTYFPPEDRGHGLIPWPHLLVRIAESYKVEREQLHTNAEAIKNNLEYLSGPVLDEDRHWDNSILIEGAKNLCKNLDQKYGGFGDAPKFPPSQMLGYLFAIGATETCEQSHPKLKNEIDQALQLCAHALVRGGLYDHVGGGFFRYSVDREWRVPHFEKMLYDNALLLEILSKCWTRSRWAGLITPIKQTVQWLLDEFQLDGGVFASALDADTEEGEGAYYLWSEKDLENAISSPIYEEFLNGFSIHGKDPLNLYPWSIEDEAYGRLSSCFEDLKELRNRRASPGRDGKFILSWNALALRSLCVAGFVFDQKDWVLAAKKGLDWIWDTLRLEGNQLGSVYYAETGIQGEGFLDDYVNFSLANLYLGGIADWLEPGLGKTYLDRGKVLADQALKTFRDPEGEGFFFCSESAAEDLIVRKKEWFDNAYPSGNSTIVHVLSLLGVLYDSESYDTILGELKEAYVEKARRLPNGIAFGLEGLTWDAIGIATIKIGVSVDLDSLLAGIRERSWRPFIVQYDSSLEDNTIQLCAGKQCLKPMRLIEDVLAIW